MSQPLREPDQVQQGLNVLRPRSWLFQMLFLSFIVFLVGFLLFGKIPITGEGNAMFLSPGTVVPLQATATGQIKLWHVGVGDQIRKGDLLAEIGQPAIEKQLEQALDQQLDLMERNKVLDEIRDRHNNLQKEAIERKRRTLSARIVLLKENLEGRKVLAEQQHLRKMQLLEKEQEDQTRLSAQEKKRAAELLKKLQRTTELHQEKLRTDDELLDVKRNYSNQLIRLADLDLKKIQQQVKKSQASDSYLSTLDSLTDRQDTIADLQQELEKLLNQEAEIDRQEASTSYTSDLERNELKRKISDYREQLDENREIRSAFDGRILELTTGQGERLTRGNRLGMIDTSNEHSPLEAVAYFTVADGKRIKPGMKIRLTPATVQRERFGSLIATVASVSSFPVTAEGAANKIGSTSVARDLTKDGHQIEVFATFSRTQDSPSGFEWDLSNGPELQINPGLIANALVNIEEKAPLTFVVPILKNWKGFGTDAIASEQ